jgi:TPP-dependent pyruvate/acetoin dehydrogenase alpha subunit
MAADSNATPRGGAERRSGKPLDSTIPSNPELRQEIGDVRDLIGRLQGFAESGYFAAPAAAPAAVQPRQSLSTLADPLRHTEPLDLGPWSGEETRKFLSMMLRIRIVEERLGAMVQAGDIVCPAHLAIGQEAPPTGVSHWLSPQDRVFGAHRSHGHYLALGGNVYQLFAEVLGRADGCSHGMGGSMHLYAPQVGFQGSVPIVAATVPVAVGAALAAKKDGRPNVSVAYFGDGAVEEGVVHESLNLAAQMKLPVLFVCENNLYASHMDIAQRQPNDRTARIAEAHSVATAVVDGNDVLAVADAAGDLIHRARCGEGPGYLEAVTYRWRGHVGPDENIDVGLRRSSEELAAWKKRDPVERLLTAMTARGDISAGDAAATEAEIRTEVDAAADRAYEAPWPKAGALLDYVYSNRRS